MQSVEQNVCNKQIFYNVFFIVTCYRNQSLALKSRLINWEIAGICNPAIDTYRTKKKKHFTFSVSKYTVITCLVTY